MGWQSFSRRGDAVNNDQATSHETSAAALESFLDGLMERLNSLVSTPSFGLLHDFFGRLADMLNGLRGDNSSPAPLGVTEDTPPGEQGPARQSTDADSGDDPASAEPHSLLDDDGTPESEDAHMEDGDEDGHQHDGDHDDAPDYDHAFAFRDFLRNGQGETDAGVSQSLIDELTHFLKDGGVDGLAAMLAQLPLFQGVQDLRDAVQNHVAEASQDDQAPETHNHDHGHHQWNHLI